MNRNQNMISKGIGKETRTNRNRKMVKHRNRNRNRNRKKEGTGTGARDEKCMLQFTFFWHKELLHQIKPRTLLTYLGGQGKYSSSDHVTSFFFLAGESGVLILVLYSSQNHIPLGNCSLELLKISVQGDSIHEHLYIDIRVLRKQKPGVRWFHKGQPCCCLWGMCDSKLSHPL